MGFVKPARGERDIVFSITVWCMWVHVCVCASICEDLSRPQLLHLCLDFKIIWHSFFPSQVEVPFEIFVQIG